MLWLWDNVKVLLVDGLSLLTGIVFLDPSVVPVGVNLLAGDHYSSTFESKKSSILAKANVQAWVENRLHVLRVENRTLWDVVTILNFPSTMFWSSMSLAVASTAAGLFTSVTDRFCEEK